MNTNYHEQLRDAVRLLVQRMGILQKAEAACCELTLSQCYTLIEVGRADEITLNELAEILNLDKSTMSRNIDNLVKSKLLKRRIAPDDRRYVLISLAESGLEMFTRINSAMDAYFAELVAAIPEQDREVAVAGVQLLVKAMMKLDAILLDENKCCK